MTQFRVFAGNTLIGHSCLEFGDPPMGVAFGKFQPTQAYDNMRKQCIAARLNGSQEHLQLSVRSFDEELLTARGGVGILDATELSVSEIEVEILGIPYSQYQKLFPEHVAAYDARRE